jgi:7-alpha-hydroxysteroid dehydrogenase
MLGRGGGAIVNIGSVAGRNAPRGSFTHSLMKSAVGQMTRLMAAELSPKIRVNAVLPGSIESRMIESMDHDRLERAAPLGRIAEPVEIAKVSLWLASDESAYATGADFVIDGGMKA